MHQPEEPSKIIAIVAALSENSVIGLNGRLPWNIPEDLHRFRELTSGQTVIMGRKTFESINSKPLKNRYNIIVSNTLKTNKAHVVPDLETAFKVSPPDKDIYIIGGSDLYKEGIQYCNYMYLTVIHKDMVGDTFFPDFDENNWTAVEMIAGNEFSFVVLNRINEEKSSTE